MRKSSYLNLVSAVSILGFIALWWLLANSGWVRPEFLPSPPKLVETFAELLDKGYGGSPLEKHVGMSVMRAITGFLLAVLIGVPFGILIGRNDVAYAIVAPIIGFLRPLRRTPGRGPRLVGQFYGLRFGILRFRQLQS